MTQLDKTAHVGGQTALELQGLSHFIPIGQQRKILLVSDLQERLPTWFRNHQWNVNMEHRCLSLFEHVPEKRHT
ncbi:MAG: AbiEi antitoxin N-terminal domain-containing protein [Candidatus Fermentibacteraceae bacterium]|nr:AbiEi antitoxin N-terminal domain-containing protein [Candidatus Fermentibacteraceae bacterium]